MSIIQGPFSVAPCQTLISRFATFFIAVQGSCVPATICLLLTPLILYYVYPPGIKETPEAPAAAEKKLQAMGPMSYNEKLVCAVMGCALVLWVGGESLGYAATPAASHPAERRPHLQREREREKKALGLLPGRLRALMLTMGWIPTHLYLHRLTPLQPPPPHPLPPPPRSSSPQPGPAAHTPTRLLEIPLLN